MGNHSPFFYFGGLRDWIYLVNSQAHRIYLTRYDIKNNSWTILAATNW